MDRDEIQRTLSDPEVTHWMKGALRDLLERDIVQAYLDVCRLQQLLERPAEAEWKRRENQAEDEFKTRHGKAREPKTRRRTSPVRRGWKILRSRLQSAFGRDENPGRTREDAL